MDRLDLMANYQVSPSPSCSPEDLYNISAIVYTILWNKKCLLFAICLCRLPGSGRPAKITPEIKKIVEDRMQEDDETTAVQLFQLLKEKGHVVSLRTILRCRNVLGWTFRGSSYCQLIRHVNKIKRLEWAKTHVNDKFEDVVWTDESTVQLETHRRFCCRKKGERPRNKPRYVMYSQHPHSF